MNFRQLTLLLLLLTPLRAPAEGSKACELPEGQVKGYASDQQLEALHQVLSASASPTEVTMEQFETSQDLINISLFATQGVLKCENFSAPIVAISMDPRLAPSNLLKIARKIATRDESTVSLACMVAIKSKTRTCILESLSGI